MRYARESSGRTLILTPAAPERRQRLTSLRERGTDLDQKRGMQRDAEVWQRRVITLVLRWSPAVAGSFKCMVVHARPFKDPLPYFVAMANDEQSRLGKR